MFGGVRLFLAFLVVLSHLVGTEYFQHFGYYAVRAFFVLSGFLLTALLLGDHDATGVINRLAYAARRVRQGCGSLVG